MYNPLTVSFNDLRNKEIINIHDGQRLGFICDILFNICTGCIDSVIVPKSSGIFNFSKDKELIIKWNMIERIGEDIILVDIPFINDENGQCCDKRK